VGVLSLFLGGICLRHWPFSESIVECKRFVVQVVFEFVMIKPLLSKMDIRVFEQSYSVRSKTICDISAVDSRRPGPYYRE